MGKLQLSNTRLMLGSFAAASIFVYLLCCSFNPMWETNDDVGMSMVAHGYGIAAIGSPNLVFSNVLWGYLVRLIPEINGVLGYSIATLSVLVIVGTALIYGLLRLGLGYLSTLAVVALILLRPVLFPQFTINAGLLMVSAIVCWNLYERQNENRALFAGCILAFLSYLVRSQEFLLVLVVALPLLSWRPLLQRRSFQVTFFTLISVIAVSIAVDHQAYQGDEWNAFKDLKPAISPIIDFGAGENLKQRPDILNRYGYSINDIDLIRRWFFVDPNIASPSKLKGMLDELGPLPPRENAVSNAWAGVKTLWHPNLLTTILAALLFAVLRPSWQLAASWGLCIAAVFVLGLLGRPGVLRVYVPLVSLLLVAPFLWGKVSTWRNHFMSGVLLFAVALNTSHVFSEVKNAQIAADQTRMGLAAFPNYPIITWGGIFPFEVVYPVLVITPITMSYQLYGLGGFTLAPFSVAFAEQQQSRGLTDILVKENGISIIANEQWFGYLEIYCREHLHGQLKELLSQKYGAIMMSQRSCRVAK